VSRIEKLQRNFVDLMGNFAREAGIVGATEGRLLGHLILADDVLSQDDLMELAGASRGNVSMAMRTLIDGGFVRRTVKKGSRRDYYEVQNDLWRITIRFVLTHLGRQIETVHREFALILDEANQIKRHSETGRERQIAGRLIQSVEHLSRYTSGALKLLMAVNKLVDRTHT